MKIHWRLGQAYTACERNVNDVLATQTHPQDVTCKTCLKYLRNKATQAWAAKRLKELRKAMNIG